MEIIKDLLKGPMEKIWNVIDREASQLIFNRLLEYQVEEYNRNYFTKTILHRAEPVRLLDFYQPLFIRPLGKKNQNEKIPTCSVKDLFKDKKSITILGTAGSGKSTIVKFLLINSIQESFKIPIRIELRYLNKYSGGLHKYIEEEVFNLEQLSVSEKATKRLLNSGDFLFFFDGYDELSSNVKEKITKDINDFTKIYSNNLFLLTSRPYTNVELLAKFSNFEVCELSKSEIEEFVKKQISLGEKEIVERIVEGINNDHSKSYDTFLSNPLLLSMFILTFQTYSTVPPKKSAFYKQVFDSLFHLHDSMSKLAYDREKKSGLSKEQFEHVLKLFSFISFFKQVFVFDQTYIEGVLNKIKETKKNLQFDNEYLIDDLQIAICILNKEGVDYVFPHRSLQEYFSSLYIASLETKQKNEVYKKLLDQFIQDDIFDLLSKDNFFALLIEQDQIGVIKHLSLPFLEKIQEDLKPALPKKRMENTLATLNYFTYSFHRDEDIFSELSAHLDEYVNKRSEVYRKVIDRSRGGRLERVEFNVEERNSLDEILNDYLRKIKPAVSKVTKSLKAFLKEELESDNNIIGLV